MTITLSIAGILRVLIVTSIFFVWVVRYDNIINEFKEYSFPDWLRDLVGIMKMTFSLMLLIGDQGMVKWGALGIAILMVAAQITHFKCGTAFKRRLPSVVLLLASAYIFVSLR